MPPVLIESVLDAVEMFVGVMIFANFDENLSLEQKIETGFVSIAILNIIVASLAITWYLRQQRKDGSSKVDWEWLESTRNLHSAASMILIIPELICEVIIYQDTFQQTDLICILALATDTGVRLNIFNAVLSKFVFNSFNVESKQANAEARAQEEAKLTALEEEIANLKMELETARKQPVLKEPTGNFMGCMTPAFSK